MPVKVGVARGAFKFNCVVVAVETGLYQSVVLYTLGKLTIAFVMPPTVPVNVRMARGALTAQRL